MRAFEVWWAELPAPVGTRPVLLLTRSGAYAYLNRVIAVEITRTVRGIAQEVSLGRAEGLPHKCVANLDNVRGVPTAALRRRAGALSAKRVAEVKRALGHALGWEELARL